MEYNFIEYINYSSYIDPKNLINFLSIFLKIHNKKEVLFLDDSLLRNLNFLLKKIQENKNYTILNAILNENYILMPENHAGLFRLNTGIILNYTVLNDYDAFCYSLENHEHEISAAEALSFSFIHNQSFYKILIKNNHYFINEILEKNPEFFEDCKIYRKHILENKIKSF